jgi:hypothetical protein
MSSLVPNYRSLLLGAAAAAGAAVSGVALAALGLGLLLRPAAPNAPPPMAATATTRPVAKIQPLELVPEPAKPPAPKAAATRPQRRAASPPVASEPCEGGWRELLTGPAGHRVYIDCPGGPLTQASRTTEPASTGLAHLAVPGTDHVPTVELGVNESFAHGTNESEP